MIRQVDESLLALGRYKRGDLVIIVAGAPPGTVGSTNLIHVDRIGEEDVYPPGPLGCARCLTSTS